MVRNLLTMNIAYVNGFLSTEKALDHWVGNATLQGLLKVLKKPFIIIIQP